MRGVHAIGGGRDRVLVYLALYFLLYQLGAALEAGSIEVSMLNMDAWAERARAQLETSQGIRTGDSNGTWGGVGGPESVSIPWGELWDAILNGNTEDGSPLGRVRMDVRHPNLEPLRYLMEEGKGGDVCIISR
jgi:hypothetical protein